MIGESLALPFADHQAVFVPFGALVFRVAVVELRPESLAGERARDGLLISFWVEEDRGGGRPVPRSGGPLTRQTKAPPGTTR